MGKSWNSKPSGMRCFPSPFPVQHTWCLGPWASLSGRAFASHTQALGASALIDRCWILLPSFIFPTMVSSSCVQYQTRHYVEKKIEPRLSLSLGAVGVVGKGTVGAARSLCPLCDVRGRSQLTLQGVLSFRRLAESQQGQQPPSAGLMRSLLYKTSMVASTLPLTSCLENELSTKNRWTNIKSLSFEREASASPLTYSLGGMATEVFLIQIKLRNKESQGS